MKLKDKIAIVTGGGAGIGRGICRCLAEEGADIAVVDIDRENAERAAVEITNLGRRATIVIADVTEKDTVSRAVTEILEFFGLIDILVNNVGGEARFYQKQTGGPYLEEKEWDDTIL
jgi:NAD(P)-dependent dehydrogenase (short-subunit alcohol dehydrogenase family)